MDITKFKKLPVMGILRSISNSYLEQLIEAVIEAGLQTIEITLNTDNAVGLISDAVKISKGRITIGAGTVLNKEALKKVVDAGATFAVTPVLIDEVADYCRDNKVPHFPGALTPTEIYRAWDAGAVMVKVFPASVFGPPYFKAVKGPLNDIQLMAVGGVTAENAGQYFQNGASAAAFGGSIFKNEWIEKKDFSSIKSSVKKFVTAVSERVK